MINEILSGVLGAILGAMISFLTLRYNYRDLYARNISANRMEWINNFREEVSIIIATLKREKSKHANKSYDEGYIFEAEKARAKLLTRLNGDTSKSGNEFNKAMTDILNQLNFEDPCINSEIQIRALIVLSRKILEPEWKRVKDEAGGNGK